MADTPLDWEKVELLRERMHITISEMSKLLSVSRATYYAWVGGGAIRGRNEKRARQVLRQLVGLVKGGQWPPAGVQHWTTEERYSHLLELLDASE